MDEYDLVIPRSIHISEAIDQRIRNVLEANGKSFLELVEIAGLDPSRDFQHKDLTGLDFYNCDLRAFNFSGSDLSKSDLRRAKLPTHCDLFYMYGARFHNTWFGDHILSPEDLPDLSIFQEDLGDGLHSPEMVIVPACANSEGFLMGDPGSTRKRGWKGQPQRRERILRRFALGRYTVTFDEYDAYCLECGIALPNDAGWGRGRRPVIGISYDEVIGADGYLSFLNNRISRSSYRLPTEIEWEYACRGDIQGENETPYNPAVTKNEDQPGNSASISQIATHRTFEYSVRSNQSDFEEDPIEEISERTMPVDYEGFLPNEFGLFQMHGNVWELTEKEKNEKAKRIIARGGSWSTDLHAITSDARQAQGADQSHITTGFRVARDL